jgi:hypothetical protein
VRGGRAPVVAERTEDQMEQEDERTIVWRTRTDDDIDGLEFKVNDKAAVLRFSFLIDGTPRPAEVEMGKDNQKPSGHPVVVRLR